MTKKRNNPFSQFAEIQKQLQQTLQPLASLQRQLPKIDIPVFRPPAFELAVREFIESQRKIAKSIESLGLGTLPEISARIAQTARRTEALDAAGWLPHYTTPFDLTDAAGGDADELRRAIEAHYVDSWKEVRAKIESQLESYGVDSESKETFREALYAHESGLYRCVCRVVFPEVERVARVELHGNDIKKKIDSQPLLRKLAGELTPTDIEPKGYYGMILFRRLREHLYETVRTQEQQSRFENDPVPNRHAAVHGLVSYSSMQHSLNAIFMTDYVLQVISFLKSADAINRK